MARKTSSKTTSPNTSAPGTPEATADVSAPMAAVAATPANAPEATGGEEGLRIVAVVVVSEIEGFRRAGRAWSRTPTTVPIDTLGEDALRALEADPLLRVAYAGDIIDEVVN